MLELHGVEEGVHLHGHLASLERSTSRLEVLSPRDFMFAKMTQDAPGKSCMLHRLKHWSPRLFAGPDIDAQAVRQHKHVVRAPRCR